MNQPWWLTFLIVLCSINFSFAQSNSSDELFLVEPLLLPSYHYSIKKVHFKLNTLTKVSFGQAKFQTIKPKEASPGLQFHRINPYFNPINGIELSANYRFCSFIQFGLHGGISGAMFEEYFYTRLEYRNVLLAPLYASFRVQKPIGKSMPFLQFDGGWLFNYQNFYRDYVGNDYWNNLTFRETGGFLLGASLGLERRIGQKHFFIQLGYEINQNRVNMYLENLPLAWIGVAEGKAEFIEYKNAISLRVGMIL